MKLFGSVDFFPRELFEVGCMDRNRRQRGIAITRHQLAAVGRTSDGTAQAGACSGILARIAAGGSVLVYFVFGILRLVG